MSFFFMNEWIIVPHIRTTVVVLSVPLLVFIFFLFLFLDYYQIKLKLTSGIQCVYQCACDRHSRIDTKAHFGRHLGLRCWPLANCNPGFNRKKIHFFLVYIADEKRFFWTRLVCSSICVFFSVYVCVWACVSMHTVYIIWIVLSSSRSSPFPFLPSQGGEEGYSSWIKSVLLSYIFVVDLWPFWMYPSSSCMLLNWSVVYVI